MSDVFKSHLALFLANLIYALTFTIAKDVMSDSIKPLGFILIRVTGAMIFQTESQLKEYGDKLSDDKKKSIEDALETLKKAHESKDIDSIKSELEKINEAWKNASEELYKAQAESGKATEPNQDDSKKSSKKGKESDDDVQDVDFEEVK